MSDVERLAREDLRQALALTGARRDERLEAAPRQQLRIGVRQGVDGYQVQRLAREGLSEHRDGSGTDVENSDPIARKVCDESGQPALERRVRDKAERVVLRPFTTARGDPALPERDFLWHLIAPELERRRPMASDVDHVPLPSPA
jgi:hypothetical protein